VRLYETATGRELATLSPPNLARIGGGEALKFSADGQWLLATKDDGETIAWNLPEIRRELAKLGLDWENRQRPVLFSLKPLPNSTENIENPTDASPAP